MSFLQANLLGAKKIPFLIISNFDKTQVYTYRLDKLQKEDIQFKIDENNSFNRNLNYQKFPLSYADYLKKFNRVIDYIKRGDTYLLNLTAETLIKTNSNLQEIFNFAKAKYKLKFKDKFVCYSPETFIKIENNIISTYPMKGTINVSIPNSKETLLHNSKENAEHIMVVDLLRNDLNMVSSNVRVEKFKYIDKIISGNRELFQMSSKISGNLNNNWHSQIGTILEKLLPAGSITGTPKKRSVEILKEIENYNRDFFTGIFGIFDGKNFNSSVMIRFIENRENKLYYKSGGGITLDSDSQTEYKELIDKIYLF